MTWHVVCRAGPRDEHAPALGAGDRLLDVPFDLPGHAASVRSSVPAIYATYLLRPAPAAEDLLRAAIGAYTADVRIARDEAYDNWTRDIALHLPVQEPAAWATGAPILARLLAFLTGDRWTVLVRPAPALYRPNRRKRARRAYRLDVEVVSLFSGGLDSFIGAIDLLEAAGQVALVGHHSAGGGPTSIAQEQAHAALRARYGRARAPLLQFWISPPVGATGVSEITTRARSILFLALGVVVASGLRASRLVVPENGPISLNVPLTPTRLGSFSTRTTHPYLIALCRDLLACLDLDLELVLPYRFHTKGEMLIGCADQGVLARGLAATMSCAHPGAGRFGEERNANQHCGRCLPCLIRRAAIGVSRPDPTSYAWRGGDQPLSPVQAADLRAVRIALERYARTPPRIGDILLPGPLPGTDDELDAYLAVFRRGIAELGRFVGRSGEREG